MIRIFHGVTDVNGIRILVTYTSDAERAELLDWCKIHSCACYYDSYQDMISQQYDHDRSMIIQNFTNETHVLFQLTYK